MENLIKDIKTLLANYSKDTKIVIKDIKVFPDVCLTKKDGIINSEIFYKIGINCKL